MKSDIFRNFSLKMILRTLLISNKSGIFRRHSHLKSAELLKFAMQCFTNAPHLNFLR